MITEADFKPCNFTVWFCDTLNNSYIFQQPRGLSAEATHAGKLKSHVLIVNSGDPIKVTGIEDALERINKIEDACK